MKPVKDQEQIDEMRKKLYDRGSAASDAVRHELTDIKVDVSRNWPGAGNVESGNISRPTKESFVPEAEQSKPKRRYRKFILLGSLLIFVFVVIVSSLILIFGGNQISNDNIVVDIEVSKFIGGCETMSLKVKVENKNSVPIESATLILRYPTGVRSVGDSPRNLLEERIPIDKIAVGEVKIIPIEVAVFGEENSDRAINASVEYRIEGSDGLFRKNAEPLAFKVNSSPLFLRVNNIEKVASGQMVDITMTAVSNASSPLTNILVSAAYPNGFSFEKSTPEPVYGQNVWKIDKLMPEESITIKLQGVVKGLTEETFRINFAAGPPNSDNQFQMDAVLAENRADFIIERPFIDVKVAINSQSGSTVVLNEGEESTVSINISNTLDETVYDMSVEVVPGGNALDAQSIRGSNQGFYDSNTGTVRWGVANNRTFATVFPGDSRDLTFSIRPGANRTTTSFDLVVNVYARRVAESSAIETLIGTSRVEAKYSSSIKIGSQASHVSGPIPPKVGEVTTYQISLVAEAGANDIYNGRVETSLPLYVNWLDEYSGDGTLTYNSVSKHIEWLTGDIRAGERKEQKIRVSIQPSISQWRSLPVLVNNQNMSAYDRYTEARLQDSAPAVTTELSTEMGYQKENGLVTN